VLARSLASRRNIQIVSIIPEVHHNQGYWEAPLRGIQKAAKEISDYNIKITYLFFNQFNVESFKEQTKEIFNIMPDAVLLAPVFRSETIELAGLLNAQNIPYVFIDSNIEGLGNLSYFGQHSYQSGFIAARLAEMGLPENATIAIAKPTGTNISNQIISRETGFRSFFEREGLKTRYNFEIISYPIENENEREVQLSKFLDANPSASAIVIFNSRAYEIATTLEKFCIKNVRLIGYDLINENIEFLRKGTITFLLAQRPEIQGYQAIMTLFNYLVLKNDVVKVQYVPIDILTKDNLDYYINF
jgi:LacI family transcriptional regulator